MVFMTFMRFNRYIVECKVKLLLFYMICGNDLIDTLWNVKVLSITNGNGATTDLIDTLWNVKSFDGGDSSSIVSI